MKTGDLVQIKNKPQHKGTVVDILVKPEGNVCLVAWYRGMAPIVNKEKAPRSWYAESDLRSQTR